MKARLVREEILEGLTSIQQIVPPKTTLPILSNFLLRAEGEHLYLSATDLDISMRTRVPAQVLESGATTVPARKFSEIVRELPEEDFQLDVSEDRTTLTCGKGQYRLSGMDWEEFPKIQENVEGRPIHLEAGVLKKLVNTTTFAVSTDETRPALGGVFFKLDGGDVTAVATDGHRLARRSLKGVVSGSEEFQAEFIVPPKALNQIIRLTGEERTIQEMIVGEKYIQVHIGETQLLSRLIEGPYPNYDLVMPKDNDKRLVVDRDLLEAAVRRVAILSNTQTHQVRFDLDGDSALLSAISPDLGGEAREHVGVSFEGAAMAVAYNAAYLLEIFRHLPAGEIELTLKTPVSAGLLQPVARNEEDDQTFLLMPLRLND
jgi:DNA polymerase-3 subunit beta